MAERAAHPARATTAAEGTLLLLLWRRGLGRGGSLLTTAGGVDWQGFAPPSLLHKRAPLPKPLPARSSRGEGVAGARLVVLTSCTPPSSPAAKAATVGEAPVPV